MRLSSMDRKGIVIIMLLVMNIASCGALLYVKRESLSHALSEFSLITRSPTDHELSKLNSSPVLLAAGRYGNGSLKRAVKIQFLGNSISLHGISAQIDWTDAFGMAASSKTNDYVHVLVRMLSEETGSPIEWQVANIADFERGPQSFDWRRLESTLSFDPDIAIFQIGENVPSTLVNTVFQNGYSELIHKVKARHKIICIPFWPDKEKSRVITEVALSTRAYLVDLSHLGGRVDPGNLAHSEKRNLHPSVAAHPGDRGMANIARSIFATARHLVE